MHNACLTDRAKIVEIVQGYIDTATFVVGHGMQQDMKWMEHIGLQLPSLDATLAPTFNTDTDTNVSASASANANANANANSALALALPQKCCVIDTQLLVVAKTNNPQNVLSLVRLMDSLGQQAVALHNAGNDAYYTLCALLIM